MKRLCYLFICVFSFRAYADFECREVKRIHQSRRLDCRVESDRGAKIFHVLELRGKFEEAAFDHGYLLSQEASRGVLQEVEARFQKGLSEGSLPIQKMKQAISSCFLNRMKASVSAEFQNAVRAIASGIQSGSVRGTEYSFEQIERSAYGVDMSIAFEGLMRQIEIDPMGTYASLGAMCSLDLTTQGLSAFLEIAKGILQFKLGCLGLVAPESTTKVGSLMHARNFDGDLVESWNTAPTLFLVSEPGYYKFAAAASAGVLYPGGISGMNEKGIATSLHEMSTLHFRTYHSQHQGVTAPFLQQRILREAGTLDEAIHIITNSKHFGAWTFLISDSKTNEVASIEVSGDRVQVARRRRNQIMGQSNHFLGELMKDQYFTYNFNKELESRSRLQVAEESLRRDSENIDLQWMMNHLAGHQDAFEGFRSFGRTATKVYTLMSTIAIPHAQEFWITLGDRMPASHSLFLGFKIDWQNFSTAPLGARRVNSYEHLPFWEESLEIYARARLSFEKGNPSESLLQLTKAMALAQRDGRIEWPYIFMRARVAMASGLMPGVASKDFELLWTNRKELHPYQQALVAMYSLVVNKRLSADEREFRRRFVESKFRKLSSDSPHFDLKKKWDYLRKIERGDSSGSPLVDFVTIE